MKANTSILNNLLNYLNNNNNSYDINKITLKSIINDLQDSKHNTTLIDIEKPINIEYINNHLKPKDLKDLYIKYNSNMLYYITVLKVNEKMVYYCYSYDGQKTKENKIFRFCYYSYDSEAKNRAAAIQTIIITQHSKYYYEMDKKRKDRLNYYNYYNKYYSDDAKIRYIFKKDFFNEYSIPEEQQRYKYVTAGYEKITLVSNILKSCEYHFNFNNTHFDPNRDYIEIDKSGYITTYRKNYLKKEARRLKEKRLDAAFKENKKDLYIKILEQDINNINNFIFDMFKAAAKTRKADDIKTISLTTEKLQKLKKDIFEYIEKLQKDCFYTCYYNNDIINFENKIIKLHNSSSIEAIKNKINDFINFSNLYNYIKTFFDYNSDFEKWLESLGYKYICLQNCYDAGKHQTLGNKMYIEKYSIYIQNYFDFMQV